MKGRVLGGRYALEKRIGEGGMGIVYKARDIPSGDTVAIKVIRSTMANESRAVKRFFREAEAASRLHHAGIVRILGEGTDVEHYLVMEYVEGVTIREWVRTFGRACKPLVALLGEILAALHHAHSRGIIHRDIKPENIVVTPEGHTKLMDFGLARPIVGPGATITQTGAIVGTVAYMSPEQAAGKRGDERSDLYSLGVVAYELFTGRRPFSGESPMATLLKHIQDEPVPPRRYNPGLPQSLEDVIMRLLLKKPDDRYASASASWDALRQSLEKTSRGEQLPDPPAADTPEQPTAVAIAPETGMRGASPRRNSPPPRIPASVRPGHMEPARRSSPFTVQRQKAAPRELRPVEVAVLYTRVQSLQQMLDERSALEAMEAVGLYERTVEAIANIYKGRVLDRRGSTQILVFDGATLANPAISALDTVKRMKQEVQEMAQRASGDRPPPDLFLSAGLYTTIVRISGDSSIEDSLREEMLNGARRMHDMSASERKYCVVCETTQQRAGEAVRSAPLKKVYISGHQHPVHAFEVAENP